MKNSLICTILLIFAAAALGQERPQLWLYQSTNLLTEKNGAEVETQVGHMYTTWEQNYADLEAFARIVHP